MKRRREGTIERYEINCSADLPAFIGATGGIGNLAEFLDKAQRRADEMLAAGPETLRGQGGRSLRQSVAWLREAVKSGSDPEALYMAVGAALEYAALGREQRDDRGGRGKITREEYFAAKLAASSRADLAARLDVSPQGLLKWEGANIE